MKNGLALLGVLICTLVASVASIGCNDPQDTTNGGGAPATTTDWTPLASTDWKLDNATPEHMFCKFIKVDHDMLITGFRAENTANVMDGYVNIYPAAFPPPACDPTVITYPDSRVRLIYAFGHGTPDYNFPNGTAISVKAGTWIALSANVSTWNGQTFTPPASGTTTVSVKTALNPSSISQIAEFTMAGTWSIDIPDDNILHNVTGSCLIPDDWTVFATIPLMRQYAKRAKLNTDHPATNIVETILDTPFDYSNMVIYDRSSSPIVMKKNDIGSAVCWYQYPPNQYNQHLAYSESSAGETCYIGMYFYRSAANSMNPPVEGYYCHP